MRTFFTDKKYQNLLKVTLIITLVVWLLIQVPTLILSALKIPHFTIQLVVLIALLLIALALYSSGFIKLLYPKIDLSGDIDRTGTNRLDKDRPLNIVLIVLLGITIVFLFIDHYTTTENVSPGTGPELEKTHNVSSDKSQVVNPVLEYSIAVLPFEDKSPNKDQAYFADGLSENLLNSIARFPNIKVIGRISSFYYKDRNVNLKTIAKELGVGLVLRGTSRRDGDHIDVTAELVDAKSGQQLWSKNYDNAFKDIFSIQDDIVKSVMFHVGGWSKTPGMTVNISAYDEYLKALGSSIITPEGIHTRIEHLEKAVTLDPNFANAWRDLSYLYRWANITIPGSQKIKNEENKANQSLEHAQELAPDSPYIRVLMAFNKASKGEWLEADHLYRDTLIASDYSPEHFAYTWYAMFLQDTGRSREAVKYFERVRAVDPLNLGNAVYLLDAYASAGNITAALAEADRLNTLDDSQIALKVGALMAALGSGDRNEIDKRLTLLSKAQKNYQSNNVRMGKYLDDPKAALEELHGMAKTVKLGAVARISIAQWAAYYGDPQFALKMLREIPATEQASSLPAVIWHPVFQEMRMIKAFKDLLRDIGLVEYWRTTAEWGDFCHPLGGRDFECN